jgi:hypothetical protein
VRVALTWTAPADRGGSPLTGYEVQYRAEGAATWSTWPTSGVAAAATVTGLDNSIRYEFRVAAVNAAGTGAFTASLGARPAPTVFSLGATTARVGDPVSARATGLIPFQTYAFVLHSTPVVLGSAAADASGALVFTFTVPASADPGAHTVTMHEGDASGPVVASAALQVVAAPAALPATGLDADRTAWLAVLAVLAGLTLAAGAGVLVLRRRATR